MWSLAYVVLVGLPAVGVAAAYAAALRSWRRTRIRIAPSPEDRGARAKMGALIVLPMPLLVFGSVVLLLLLGEDVPDAMAQPAALAYGVAGLLSGMGVAIVYGRGFTSAILTKEGYGRVMPLAVMPFTSAVFGLVISLLLIGGMSNLAPSGPWTMPSTWLASLLAMVGGVGALVSAWLASSAWDFDTKGTWPMALLRSSRGGYVTLVSFAVAMALLQEWLILLFVVLYFGAAMALGVALLLRARRKRRRGITPK